MNIHTLDGDALNWAVAHVLGAGSVAGAYIDGGLLVTRDDLAHPRWAPVGNPAQGQPLMEEHGVSVSLVGEGESKWWAATSDPRDEETFGPTGPTQLTAAMRAIVLKFTGEDIDEIYIPDAYVSGKA